MSPIQADVRRNWPGAGATDGQLGVFVWRRWLGKGEEERRRDPGASMEGGKDASYRAAPHAGSDAPQ